MSRMRPFVRLSARSVSVALVLVAGGCFDAADSSDSSGSGTESGTEGTSGSSGGSTTGGTSGSASGSATTTASSGTSMTSGGTTTDSSGTAGTSGGTCDAGECAAAAPMGWNGPGVVSTADSMAGLAECPDGYPSNLAEVFDEPAGAPAACSACTCGDPVDVQCTPPKVQFWGNSNCNDFNNTGPDFEATLSPPGQCKVFNQPSGGYGAESDSVVAVPGTGSCPASGGEPTLPDAVWGKHARMCGEPMNGGACADGVCVPTPGDDFGNRLCIWRDGDVSCPPGDYINREVWYTQIADDRDCTACQCTTPGGAQCDAEIEFHDNAQCSDPYVTIDDPGQQCVTLFGVPPASAVFNVKGTIGGSCGPSGGEASGGVTPDGPVTVCCT